MCAKAATYGRAAQAARRRRFSPWVGRSGCVPAEPYPPPRASSSVAPGKAGQTVRPPPPAIFRRDVGGCDQFPISLVENLLLQARQFLLGRRIADGAVQTHLVVVRHVMRDEAPGLFQRGRAGNLP